MPDGLVVTKEENDWDYNGAFPAVVKPTKMENSVGVELVRNKEEMEAAIERAWAFGEALIIDAFVPGREVGCNKELNWRIAKLGEKVDILSWTCLIIFIR